MEHLEWHEIIGNDGETVYGMQPPSKGIISYKVDEIIDEIEKLKNKYQSGYLRSKFG